MAARPVPPCDLKPAPGPIPLAARVDAGGFFVTTKQYADLAMYLANVREWMGAADACIKGRE